MSTTAQRLSRRVRELAPSMTFALADKAKALKAAGRPVISFSVGEPDFASPEVVAAAAKEAIDRGETHYTPVRGTPRLIEAIVERTAQDTGYRADPEQVLVSNGGKQSLFNLFLAFLDPGDEVVLASPYWVSYPAMIQLAGGRAVPVAADPARGFRLDPDEVAAAMGPRCKALLLNTPSNPTGAVLDPGDVEALVRLALDRGVLVVSDEIYAGLLYDGAEHRSALSVAHPGVREGVVLCSGVSKRYAMTGWRIGYVVGPTDLVAAAAKLQSQSTSGACSIAQAAAAAALREGEEAAAAMRDVFARRRRVAVDALQAIPGVRVPEAKGAFYLFPDVSSYYGRTVAGRRIGGSLDLSEVLLEEANVAAVPGAAFGADGHLRFSYALDEEQIVEGLSRVRELLARAEPAAAAKPAAGSGR